MNTANNKTVLVVDDEADLRELLSITLQQMQLQPVAVGTVKEAKDLLAHASFDLCLTDMNLPDGNGIELVRHINKNYSGTPTAMITAYGSMDTATQAMKEGAYDFIAKPVTLARLRQVVEDGLALQQHNTPPSHHELLGSSAKAEALRQNIAMVSRSQAPIFIHNANGANSTQIAQLIHAASPRAEQPFIHINCAAQSTETIEQALFGYYAKANDVSTYQAGSLAAAHGGTVFLEEVGQLPHTTQLQLLQALQQRSLQPKGSQRIISFNTRIISSSTTNLAHAVADKTFRQDLYFRLNVLELTVPSLLERREDIPALANHFLHKLAAFYAVPNAGFSAQAINALSTHNYTGDMQELENIIERALTLCNGKEISPEHLGLSSHTPALMQPTLPLRPPEQPLADFLEDIERQEILATLESTMWNRTAAAKRLGMSVRSLRYRLEKLAIEAPEED